MFAFLRRVVLGLLAAIGAYVTITDFAERLSEKNKKEISWTSDGRYLFRPSNTYKFSVRSIDGSFETQNGLYNSIVDLWSTGSDTINSEEIRSPLKIASRFDQKIISYKLISTRSTLTDNFHIDQIADGLVVKWKVFDPDMAIKISVLHTGDDKSLIVEGKLGPSAEIIKYSRDTTRTLISALFLFFGSIAAFGYGFYKLLNWNEPDYSIPKSQRPFLQRNRMAAFLIGMLILLCFYFSMTNIVTPYFISLTQRPSSPLPLGFVDETDASVR